MSTGMVLGCEAERYTRTTKAIKAQEAIGILLVDRFPTVFVYKRQSCRVYFFRNLRYFHMQDILTSLVRAESEPGLGVERLRGNVRGCWFIARTNRSAAFSFSDMAEYVGAVLTASSSPAGPIQSIDNAPRAGQGAFYIQNSSGWSFSPPRPHELRRDRLGRSIRMLADSEGKRRMRHVLNIT